MPNQLVIYSNRAQDHFRWCWLDEQLRPMPDSAASGDLETLAAGLGADYEHTAWLLLPGNRVVTRELDYEEAEKRHLRRLLPYQLEEHVIGDIDQFHFALGPAREGRAVVAYCERTWLRELVDRLAEHHIEVKHGWPLPLCLPLAPDTALSETYPHWTVQLQEDELQVRYAPHLGYCVPRGQGRASLQMLLTTQNRVDDLPRLSLRAATDADLVALESLLPAELRERIDERELVTFWELSFPELGGLDLCQGEFAQRLPIERWWRDWRTLVVTAAAALVLYVGTTVYQVQSLESENLETRRHIESVYRQVAGSGNLVDAERQLRQKLEEANPSADGRRVTPLLADLFPVLAEAEEITLSAISYSGRSGELNLNVQAEAFNTIEQLRGQVQESGLNAELVSASAQGGNHSARLRVSGGES